MQVLDQCWDPYYLQKVLTNVGGMIVVANICGFVGREDDNFRLQNYIDQLINWVKQRQMEFNPHKYKVMHFGTSNKGRKSAINS